MVGRRKLPDPSLNHIFNVLSTGAQYTLSFQWTDFGLKCLLLQNGSYTFAYFLIVSTIKMKVGQILVYLIANISNVFLAHSWRLETSSRPFQDFSEMTKKRDPSIFSSWYLPSLILSYSPFQKNELLETWRNWLLSNWSKLPNCKRPRT